jgi:hypothetical protein
MVASFWWGYFSYFGSRVNLKVPLVVNGVPGLHATGPMSFQVHKIFTGNNIE